jgi:hypothetical protein
MGWRRSFSKSAMKCRVSVCVFEVAVVVAAIPIAGSESADSFDEGLEIPNSSSPGKVERPIASFVATVSPIPGHRLTSAGYLRNRQWKFN